MKVESPFESDPPLPDGLSDSTGGSRIIDLQAPVSSDCIDWIQRIALIHALCHSLARFSMTIARSACAKPTGVKV